MAFLRLDMWDKSQRWTPNDLERFHGLASDAFHEALVSDQLDEKERDELLDEYRQIMTEAVDKMPKKLRKKYGRKD